MIPSHQSYDFKELTEARKRAEIPIYSFSKHAREKETTSIYSPHVLVLEGIFALYDPRVLELLDMKVSEVDKVIPRHCLISPIDIL